MSGVLTALGGLRGREIAADLAGVASLVALLVLSLHLPLLV